MARVFIDGFEAGQIDLWDTNVGAELSTGIAGMDGTYCVKLYGTSDYLIKKLPAKSEYYVAFRYRPIGTGNGHRNVISFYNVETRLGTVKHENDTSGPLKVLDGSDNVLATGSANLTKDTTYLVEVRFKPGTTDGIFQVKVDGVLDIDFSGNVGTSLQIDSIRIGYITTFLYSGMYVDNVVVDDAGWPGNTLIRALVPTGAGNSTQWTPSSGSNWECVDEIPASDSDYVNTDTMDQVDLYAAGELPSEANNVKCVQVQIRAMREGNSLNVQRLRAAVRTNNIDYFSDFLAVPTTNPVGLVNLWENNPNTGLAWTLAEVNAMEIGMKAVA